jgi:hypothetical protein
MPLTNESTERLPMRHSRFLAVLFYGYGFANAHTLLIDSTAASDTLSQVNSMADFR